MTFINRKEIKAPRSGGHTPGPSRRDLMGAAAAGGLALVGAAALPRAARSADKPIYFTYSGYEISELHPEFYEKYGFSPQAAYFAAEEEAYARLIAGFKCDLVHPCSYLAKQWKDSGLTQAIDTSRLSNWPDLFPAIRNLPGTQIDGKQYHAPFDWGRSSIAYREDLVDIEEESWSILWDPRYKGKVSATESAGETVSAAIIYIAHQEGLNPMVADWPEEAWEKVLDALRQLRDNVRFFNSDYMTMWDGLESGEIVAAVTWDGLVPYMRDEGVPVRFMNPVEGVMTWVCGLVLLKDAPNEDLAYELMDSMLGPRAGEFLIGEYGIPHSNRISFERVGEARIAELDLPADPEELFANSIFYDDYEDYQETTRIFEEIRAGF